jgi:hypothetical protein
MVFKEVNKKVDEETGFKIMEELYDEERDIRLVAKYSPARNDLTPPVRPQEINKKEKEKEKKKKSSSSKEK